MPHTVWFTGSSYTHTRYVHKHKYSNVQIYMGLTDHFPFLQHHPAPQPVPYPSRLRSRTKAGRGLAGEGRNLEEGEVLLPSPHRHLRRVLSLSSGTVGQRAGRAPLPLCCGSNPRGLLWPLCLSPLALLCFDDSSFPLLPFCTSLLLSLCVLAPPSACREEGPQATEGLLAPLPCPRASEKARTSVQLSRGIGAIGRLSVGGRC